MENILLVFGGKSYEHDISVVTASQIYNRTKLDNIKMIPLYVSRTGEFFIYKNSEFSIKDFSIKNFKSNSKNFKEAVFVSGEKCRLFLKTKFGLKEYLHVENAIFACHGGAGENGELVSYFNNLGIGTSVGNVCSLSVCMNKFIFKNCMKGFKVPVVQGFKVSKFDYKNNLDSYLHRFKFLEFPVIIKSNSGGSSIGLFIANSREDFYEKLEDAFEFDDEVLIEKYQKHAREFNVAILGTENDFIISEIDEPVKENEVLSFADKYLSGGKSKGLKSFSKENSMVNQNRKFPADISEELEIQIKQIARKIFKNLGLYGIVRIDFLYREDINKLFVCEVNAIPGSLAYYFFEENKISSNELVKKLLSISKLSKKKHDNLKIEYFTNILD